DHRGDAVTTSHVGDLAALLEFSDDTIESWQPRLHQMIVVARPEKAGDRAGQALGLIAPRDAFTRAESVFHLWHIKLKRRRSSKCRCEIERAGLARENKRLLGRHRELFGRRIKHDILRCCLGGEPLSQITLLQSRLCGQFPGSQRIVFAQSLVEPETFPDLDEWDAKGAAEVVENAAHKGV